MTGFFSDFWNYLDIVSYCSVKSLSLYRVVQLLERPFPENQLIPTDLVRCFHSCGGFLFKPKTWPLVMVISLLGKKKKKHPKCELELKGLTGFKKDKPKPSAVCPLCTSM